MPGLKPLPKPVADVKQMSKTRHLWASLALAIFAAFTVPEAAAQDKLPGIEAQVNSPFVIQYGFGSYNIGGISSSTYRLPIVHSFALGEGDGDWTLRLTSYLGYNYSSFETNLLGPKLIAEQDYIFVLPQVELLIPLGHGWTLKPYVSAGGGYAFNGSAKLEGYSEESIDDSWDVLYGAGLGILYEQPFASGTFQVGSKVGWAADVSFDGGEDQGYSTVQTGLEVRHPIGLTFWGKKIDLAGSFIHYHFLPAAEFTMITKRPLKISNQYEFGSTIGMAKPGKLWFLTDPRIGVSYRFGDGMDGFRLNLGFPF